MSDSAIVNNRLRGNTICAVVPAAGRGSRLGLSVPKLLAPIVGGVTIWTILREKLLSVVGRIHLVVSPEWELCFKTLLAEDPCASQISYSIQTEARGMGDAIFGAYSHWSRATILLVVWGDQIHISTATLKRSLARHSSLVGRHCTVPTAFVDYPYVQYCFNALDELTEIRESREGAICDQHGFSDVGSFVLDVPGLYEAWDSYSKKTRLGVRTGEINFLPFLPYLAHNGWRVSRLEVQDPLEARGVNSVADLTFFQELYATRRDTETLCCGHNDALHITEDL